MRSVLSTLALIVALCGVFLASPAASPALAQADSQAAAEEEDEPEKDTTTPESGLYRQVDEKGRTIFTDQPAPARDTDKLDVAPVNTAPPPPRMPAAPSPGKARKERDPYKKLAITQPAEGAYIANGLLPFNVSVTIRPALRELHKLRLVIDGDTYQTGRKTSFTVDSIARGDHSLEAVVVDSKGKEIQRSEAVNIFAQRPSTAIP